MAYTYMIQHARVRGNAIDKDTMTEARAGWLAREARCPRFARFRESRVASREQRYPHGKLPYCTFLALLYLDYSMIPYYLALLLINY